MTTILRVLCLGWGLILVTFAGCELAAPRGRLVEAVPAPGTTIEGSPSAIVLRFSEPITKGSEATLRATYTLDEAGEPVYDPGVEFRAEQPDPADASHRTLSIALSGPLPKGLYAVQWRTVAVNGSAIRYGTVHYAVGTSIPDHILSDHPGGVYERNVRQRRTMATLAGGLILIALAFLVGRRP